MKRQQSYGWMGRCTTTTRDRNRIWSVWTISALVIAALMSLPATQAGASFGEKSDVITLAKDFGLIVGPVTEDVRKELNLRRSGGVVVYEVIGGSLAELAGIKVRAVIAEINSKPVRNLDDFKRLLVAALKEGNFTVGSWEPTSPENQGQGQQMNFHFVPNRTD